MSVLFTTGDISGGRLAALEFETTPWDGPRLLPRDLADHLRRRDPDAAPHPAFRARHPDDDRPGRGAVHGPPLVPPTGPAAARPRGDPRADALGYAVSAGREPADRRELVPPLPGRPASAGCRRSPRSAAGGSAADARREDRLRAPSGARPGKGPTRLTVDAGGSKGSAQHGSTPPRDLRPRSGDLEVPATATTPKTRLTVAPARRPGPRRLRETRTDRGVSSPSHDGHQTPRFTHPRACQRADPRLGRAPGTARQPARAGHRGRPGRGRGAGRFAQAPVDQEGVEGVGARPRDLDDGPDHPRGEGHARQDPGDVRQGDAPAAGRPDDPVGRRGVRLPGARGRGEGRPPRLDRQGRQRRDRLPVRPDLPRHQGRRGPRGASRPAPTRSTWSSIAARSCRATT